MPTEDAKPALWTPLFAALTIANLGVAIIFYMLTSTLSGWALAELGANQTQAGMVGTVWFIGAMVARLFAGRMVSGLGERAVVLGSVAVMFAGCLLYPLCHAVWPLIALRFVHGLAFGVTATALAGVVLSRVPVRRRGEGSGWFTFGLAIASGAGPFVGAYLQRTSGGQGAVFTVAIACGALALLLSLLVSRQLKPRAPGGHQVRHTLSDYLEVKVLPVALVVSLCAMPFGAILTLLAPYGREIELVDAAGLYFLAYALVITVSRPVAGMLQDRHGDLSIMLPIMAAMVVGVVLTALAESGWVLVLAGALLGLGYGTLVPAGQTVALNLVGSARASIGVGSYFLLVDAGTGIGPFVLGALVEPLGYRGAFLVGAGCATAGLLAMAVLQRRLKHRPTARVA